MSKINDSVNKITGREQKKYPGRYSFSNGDKFTFKNHTKSENNPLFGLRRCLAVSNLALSDSDKSPGNNVKIEYTTCATERISSKNYVYCGSATKLPVNSCGMSIDNNGHLILIKGKSYNLFKGVTKKYTTGYKYKTARLTSSESDRKFENLYIDDNGLIIGTERNTGHKYAINISIPDLDTTSHGQYVNVNLTEYTLENDREELTFKADNGHFVSFFTKDNKLYLNSIQKKDDVKEYLSEIYEIEIPLSKGYSVSSIKKSMGLLQVEVKKGYKRRVLYADPNFISNDNIFVGKTSHKPQQNFFTRMGNDPHEKYHAGLPFTSDRKGNFSSDYIPFFSSTIDNFRGCIKKIKQCSVEGRPERAIAHIVKAIDPGISAVCTSAQGLIKSTSSVVGNKIDSKEKLHAHNINMLRAHSHHLSKVANDALGVKPKHNFSESLIKLVNEIKFRDILHLTSSYKIAAFFGIASGGLPFSPGWFAGIVAELSDRHNLAIAKTATGNIRLSFSNRHKVAAIGLAGTGSGLERTLLNSSVIDYMTVMPFEANAIISAQSILGNDFSFDLTEEHFKEFFTQFSEDKNDSLIKDMVITEAEAVKRKEKEFLFRIEAKSEMRLQAGSMINSSTYMVMPRTAVGARLALDLLKLKSSISESVDNKDIRSHSSEENFTIGAFNHEAALFAEWKIMPIVMHGGGDDILWCHPLPLLEEGKSIIQHTNKKPFTFFEKTVNDNKSTASANVFSTVNSIDTVSNIPVFITNDVNKGIKTGLTIKNVSGVDKHMALVFNTLKEIRKSLVIQQRNSQNKSCEINVISHYEKIASPVFPLAKIIDNQLSKSPPSENISYRLKKLEFRRNGSLQHTNATVPMPILNLSNVHSITYDQYLGEIEFQYTHESDLTSVNAVRKMVTLY